MKIWVTDRKTGEVYEVEAESAYLAEIKVMERFNRPQAEFRGHYNPETARQSALKYKGMKVTMLERWVTMTIARFEDGSVMCLVEDGPEAVLVKPDGQTQGYPGHDLSVVNPDDACDEYLKAFLKEFMKGEVA